MSEKRERGYVQKKSNIPPTPDNGLKPEHYAFPVMYGLLELFGKRFI
jgi:hypothetical protein